MAARKQPSSTSSLSFRYDSASWNIQYVLHGTFRFLFLHVTSLDQEVLMIQVLRFSVHLLLRATTKVIDY